MKPADFTAKSTMAEENGRYRFTFLCALCGEGRSTQPIAADTAQEALEAARREARVYFNRCHRCGRWVCDDHYNEDVMLCTGCAPREPD
jgi:hypothetical protein